MKKLSTIITALFLVTTLAAQTIWVADNRPTAPSGGHVFNTIQAALDTASPGDIIHIIPSQSFYDSPTIGTDSLTIFGIGFNPKKDQPNKVWMEDLIIATNTNGVRISGLNINDELIISNSTGGSNGNIFIENSDIARITSNNQCCTATTHSNIVIRNCIIGNRETATQSVISFVGTYISATSIVITNNVILSSSSTGTHGALSVADAIIKNNLFLADGSASDRAFNSVTTSTISNNIFLGQNLSPGSSLTNSTFSNNISFGSTDNGFPIGSNGNTGDSTLANTDPELTNVPLADDWDFSYDPTPDTGSPAIDAGNDGTDVGLTGSTIPFSTTGTPLPVISVLRVPEVIKQGTNLDATIEATGN